MPGLHPKYHNIYDQSSVIICTDLFSRWKAWMPPYRNSIDPSAWCRVCNVRPRGEPVHQLELCKANSSCLWNLLQPNRNKTSEAFQIKPVWSLVYKIFILNFYWSYLIILSLFVIWVFVITRDSLTWNSFFWRNRSGLECNDAFLGETS